VRGRLDDLKSRVWTAPTEVEAALQQVYQKMQMLRV
jgi:hypothetical protein